MIKGPDPDFQDVRLAKLSDIPSIVLIHQAAFPSFFMTMLGPKFLSLYYTIVISSTEGILFVKSGGNSLEGFVCGFINPNKFYTNLRRHRWSLLRSFLPMLCMRPWLLTRLYSSYIHSGQSLNHGGPEVCELSSIGVSPKFFNQGIGRILIYKFIEHVKDTVNCVRLTTEAFENKMANNFYSKLGFILSGTIERSKGRILNIYEFEIKKPL